MNSRVGLLVLLLLLAFLGIADAWYLTAAALDGASLVCDIGGALDDCNIVAQSPYSILFGIPLALYGLVFFSLSFIVSAVLLVRASRLLYGALAVLGLLGFSASIVFLLIQLLVIKAVCIYCIASAVIAAFVWLISLRLWRRYGREIEPEMPEEGRGILTP
ncbi:MAG TPA: vitamin K epoxide reductase family protein [Candidatus Paceibacterota bacterium]|nr:vitamin K epoxide reductase family protein [Candidatus Paceibacterota bacterium]